MVKEVAEDESSDEEEVFIIQEHVAPGKLAITPSSADLLHIVLNRFRHVVVDDGLNIRFIDTHTESDGANEHADLILYEHLLDCISLLVGFSSMVRRRIHSILCEN